MYGSEFIYQAYIEDLSVCDRLIELHKNSPKKTAGKVGGVYALEEGEMKGKSQSFNLIKESTDVVLLPENDLVEMFVLYNNQLQTILNQYVSKFKYSGADDAPWTVTEYPNIQHYSPGQGYKAWHFERVLPTFPNCARHLVYMTYLNDVHMFGETEFYYQQLKVKPKKGLTLVWPADWTFTHRGIVAPNEDKYIITGWLNYVELDNNGNYVMEPRWDPFVRAEKEKNN